MATYDIEPKVLIWAREESGFSFPQAVETLARHLGNKEPGAKLAEIESGTQKPTLSLLRAMSTAYNVSLITLFLPTPPASSKPPTDFRTLRGQTPTISIETRLAIKSALRYQGTITELVKDIPEIYQPFDLPVVTLNDEAEVIAATERERLGVSLEMQRDWNDAKEAFDAWRWRIEQLGVHIFTFKMPVDDCRGFVLKSDDDTPVIVANSEDGDEAQMFTVFHEYAHLLLRRFGICGRTENVDERAIESYSNNFAASVLMPKNKVIELAEICSTNEHSDFNVVMDAVRAVSRYFKVSGEAAILRLELLRQVPLDSHDEYVRRMQGKRRPAKGGRGPYHRRYLNKLGNRYVSVILTALHHNYIDAVEADDMLDGVKSRHFHELEVDLANREKKFSKAPPP